jgi:ketosteroid isomerase-like protein
MTRTIALSRRYLLAAGAGSLVVACGGAAREPASAATGAGGTPQTDILKRYYAAWVTKDWATVDGILSDDFTFTSAAGDDHISKVAFKAQCWETQIPFIEGFELERVAENANDVFVKYVCRTKNGKSFRNVEHVQFKDNKVTAITCYFGEQMSFPSAVSNKSKT